MTYKRFELKVVQRQKTFHLFAEIRAKICHNPRLAKLCFEQLVPFGNYSIHISREKPLL